MRRMCQKPKKKRKRKEGREIVDEWEKKTHRADVDQWSGENVRGLIKGSAGSST